MNLAMIFILMACILHTIGTIINNEETGKILRNMSFCFYGIIFILMIGGVIQ